MPTDVGVAAAAAVAAAEVLRMLRGGVLVDRALGDVGDAGAQEAILAVLTAERPDDVVFSEEATDDRRRLSAARVWIVDPWTARASTAIPPGTTGPCTWRCGRPGT